MAYIKKIWKDYPDTTTPILASDMNNIENGLETVDTLSTTTANNVNNGWIPLTGTFAYSSADSPTFVMSTSVDLTGIVGLGMRIKLTQTTTKYFIVTAITSNSITMYGGTDYTLTSDAISNVYYSMLKAPFGFPMSVDKWSVTKKSNDRTLLTTVVVGTVYNLASLKISVPIGSFNLIATGCCFITHTSNNSADFIISLSTSATSISNSDNSVFTPSLYSSGAVASININKLITNTAKVDYYLVETVTYATTTVSSLDLRGESQMVILKAVCAYL
jgi:hypothetical protein